MKALEPLHFQRNVVIVGFGGKRPKASSNLKPKSFGRRNSKVPARHHAGGSLLEKEEGVTLIVCGDTPLLETETLKELLSQHRDQQADLTILTAVVDHPYNYGRILRDNRGHVEAIVEQADANPEQNLIKEINAGVYVFDNQKLFAELANLQPTNKQGEYISPI
jgi:bifunctional UDP-N-acetylglucosamine pyrophosphorylase/glucosamine-1-phosphate N-acetyltransferase